MQNKLYHTADNNNEGIKAEAAGDIKIAIQLYEQNLSEGYPATYSYERLMIIYKKLKRPDDEIRVINRAIEVFSLENKSRFKSAINNLKNKDYLIDIQASLLTGNVVRNKEGNVIFNPYPVLKYVARKNKIIKLQNKLKGNTTI